MIIHDHWTKVAGMSRALLVLNASIGNNFFVRDPVSGNGCLCNQSCDDWISSQMAICQRAGDSILAWNWPVSTIEILTQGGG